MYWGTIDIQKKRCIFNVHNLISFNLNTHFSKEDIQITNRYMKRCWTSLIIRKMQIKTTMSYYPTPVMMAIIKKIKDNKWWWRCGEIEILVQCWWGCKMVEPLCVTIMEVTKKIKNRTTLWSSSTTPNYMCRITEIRILKSCLHSYTYCSLIHKNQDMETI